MSKSFAHISDQQLLDRFHETGDNQWLGIVLERYTLLLFGVCMKYLKNEEEAKDAVQQIFLKALTELPKYKVTYLKSWLYTVARNHCLMRLRDKHKEPVGISDNLSVSPGEPEDNRLEHLDRDRQYTLMEEALSELSPEQRTCVQEFYLAHKTYQQIADQTGYNYMQVKSYIQNGKRNLKQLLLRKMGAS